MHCKIEGPAAYDVLKNFEQRWGIAAKWRDFKLRKVTHWHEDALLRLERISWIPTPSPGPDGDKNVYVTDEEDPENWHAQVGRLKGILSVLTLMVIKYDECSFSFVDIPVY